MPTFQHIPAFQVTGLELRTSNPEASRTIPPHWARFSSEGVLARIPGRLSDDVYAVYTHFEHAGRDNEGVYSLVIGAAVDPAAPVPAGLVSVAVPASARMVFAVEPGRTDRVASMWQTIWDFHERTKTFIADYERYRPSGEIDIFIGIES